MNTISFGRHADLVGYLLRTLTDAERGEADNHIAECRECSEEIASLGGWTAELDRVSEAVLIDGPPDGGDLLLQRTLRRVRAESDRSRRRWVTTVAAGVAAVVLIGSGAVVRVERTGPSSARPAPTTVAASGTRTVSAVDAGSGARITVALVPASGWVRVAAAVSGVPAGERCRIQVVGRAGQVEQAAGWTVSETGAAEGTRLEGSALIDLADVSSVRVFDTAGHELVSAAF
jgi:hypothetical protein